MPTSYSPLLGLALPVTGELSGTWGDTVNDYITKYLDSSVAGTQTISGSQTAVTLSVTNGTTLVQVGSGATGSAQYQVINCTGNPASLLTVTVPAQSKTYVVVNATSTSQQVKIVGVGPTTGVTLDAGEKAVVAWNGSDFIKVATSTVDGVSTISFGTTGLTPSTATSGAVTVAGTLVAANGGTGQSTYTTGDLLYATGSTALSKLGIGTNGQILTSTGTAPQWSTLSGVAVTTFSAGTTGFTPSSATSGAVTLAGTLATTNGGTGLTSFTANGVVYASSSSALTTGSALTFDGSKLTVKGGNAGQFVLDNGGQQYVQQIFQTNATANTGGDFLLDGTNNTFAFRGLAANMPFVWSLSATAGNPSEQMRLTSTGLGIGTSSPANKFVVSNAGANGFEVNPTSGVSSGASLNGYNRGTSAFTPLTYTALAHYFQVGSSPATAATLDSSGNLGIGTSSPLARLTVSDSSNPNSGTMTLGDNASFNGTLQYLIGPGELRISQVGSSSLGTTFYTNGAERMRLDSSGNLGIGTSSPSVKLDVFGRAKIDVGTYASGYALTLGAISETGRTYQIGMVTGGSLAIYDSAAAAQRVVLDTSGNLGIGTSSPGVKLDVVGAIRATTGMQNANGTSFYWGTGTAYILGSSATNTINLGTNGVTQATLDSSGNLGLGVTPSSWGSGQKAFETQAGSLAALSTSLFDLVQNTYNSGTGYIYKTTAAATVYRQTAGQHLWFNAASGTAGATVSFTQAMTLNASGNLGIGTSSPAARFEISGTTSFNPQQYITNTDVVVGGKISGVYFYSRAASNGWYSGIDAYVPSGAPGVDRTDLRFYTTLVTPAERMRLDSSGNLGLGVTPSAWSSSAKALEIGVYAGFYRNASGITAMSFNSYQNTSNIDTYRVSANAATKYEMAGGHAWYIAPSGTAGNAISFTQAMTLDSNGRLGIGTTSPSERLHIYGSNPRLRVEGDGSSYYPEIRLDGINGTIWFSTYFGPTITGADTSGTGPITFRTGGTVSGGAYGGTEVARFTSSGYFKASNTGTYTYSGFSLHEFNSSAASNTTLAVVSTNTSYNNYVMYVEANRNTTNNTFYSYAYYNLAGGAYRFLVADSGNVTNTNGSYGTISDAKMKTDIVDAGSQWADIKAVRFRKFKMKDDPEQIVQLGVVAQELEQTSPGLVDEHTDRDKEGNDLGTTTKSVKTSVLLMKAAVALQEAMARIEQLEAKVAALEAK